MMKLGMNLCLYRFSGKLADLLADKDEMVGMFADWYLIILVFDS